METTLYDAMAVVFAHPGDSFEADVSKVISLCQGSHPRAAEALATFKQVLPKGDRAAQEELHLRTFDIQPITSLDIGYTLFGEDYKRGVLLANLSNEHTRAQNDCGGELSDHLTNVLRLLPRLADEKFCEELVRVVVAPAVREMIREFEPASLAKKEQIYKKHHKTLIDVAVGEQRTAYRHALEALQMILQQDFSLLTRLPTIEDSKFATAIGTELRIESENEDGSTAYPVT